MDIPKISFSAPNVLIRYAGTPEEEFDNATERLAAAHGATLLDAGVALEFPMMRDLEYGPFDESTAHVFTQQVLALVSPGRHGEPS